MELSCEKFVKLINDNIEFYKMVETVDDTLDISLYDTKIERCYYQTFDTIMKFFFNEAGIDLIYWWLLEDVEKIIYDSTNEHVIARLDRPEDLYDYLMNDVTTTHTYLND